MARPRIKRQVISVDQRNFDIKRELAQEYIKEKGWSMRRALSHIDFLVRCSVLELRLAV